MPTKNSRNASTAVVAPAPMMLDQLIMAKALAILVLGLGSFALGVLPLKLAKWCRAKPDGHQRPRPRPGPRPGPRPRHSHAGDTAADSRVVAMMLCYGGGVLLYTTLLHLQPEVRESVARLQRANLLSGAQHLGDLVFSAGFFLAYAMDETVHAALRAVRSRAAAVTLSLSAGAAADDVPSGAHGTYTVMEFLEMTSGERPAGRDARETPGSDDGGDEDGEDGEDGGGGGEDSTRGLFTVLALSFHEVFEGLAIGLEERAGSAWYLFLAVASHKLLIAFCIGLELAWSKTRTAVLVLYVATFAAVTPAGIACGMALLRFGGAAGTVDGSPGPTAVLLQGIAAGTLLYVVVFEVLARHKYTGLPHLLCVIVGFGSMMALQTLFHQHSHDSVDDHHYSGHDHSEYGHSIHSHSSHNHIPK